MNVKKIPKKVINTIKTLDSIEKMLEILNSPYSYSEADLQIGDVISFYNKMDLDEYSYVLDAPYGDVYGDERFEPVFSPREMLEYGVFEGKYLNDCILEFPREWFIDAIANNKLSPEGPNINCNYFKIKSRQNLDKWEENGWIYSSDENIDNRGWFQWYCRYYMGRRDEELDEIQIKRWRSFKRHYGQVVKNCNAGDLTCRPKQRQALLQWSYNCFV